ncbi:MAG: hypothetical protein AABY22_21670 [Nanoarchaeota archaeon]
MDKPRKLYHGSSSKIAEGVLQPVFNTGTKDYKHTKAAVFGTERQDLAALFMFTTEHISSIGFENDVAFICIWGKSEELQKYSGYMYVLPGDSFEKVGKDYEWQSFTDVKAIEVKEFPDVVTGMMEFGVQVYFIDDEKVFDKIVENIYKRAEILKDLHSENQKLGLNVKKFDW